MKTKQHACAQQTTSVKGCLVFQWVNEGHSEGAAGLCVHTCSCFKASQGPYLLYKLPKHSRANPSP